MIGIFKRATIIQLKKDLLLIKQNPEEFNSEYLSSYQIVWNNEEFYKLLSRGKELEDAMKNKFDKLRIATYNTGVFDLIEKFGAGTTDDTMDNTMVSELPILLLPHIINEYEIINKKLTTKKLDGNYKKELSDSRIYPSLNDLCSDPDIEDENELLGLFSMIVWHELHDNIENDIDIIESETPLLYNIVNVINAMNELTIELEPLINNTLKKIDEYFEVEEKNAKINK